MSEHDTTHNRKRQRQRQDGSPNSNGNEELRKRTRRATGMRSRANLAPAESPRTESPIPWVQSDIAGVSSSRSRRIRRPSQKWRDSQYAGADGGAVPDDVPVQSPTSSSWPSNKLKQDEAEDAEFHALKSRLVELEQDRNKYRDMSKQRGQDILILQAKMGVMEEFVAANKPLGSVKWSRQEAARATWSSKASTTSTVDDSILAPESELLSDQAGLQPYSTACMC